MLDEKFERFLIQRMGPKAYEDLSQHAKTVALSYWRESVKPNFTGVFDADLEDPGYFIPIPGASNIPKANIQGGFLYMERQVIEFQKFGVC